MGWVDKMIMLYLNSKVIIDYRFGGLQKGENIDNVILEWSLTESYVTDIRTYIHPDRDVSF